ncbi:MAG: class I SAM-dependent methyltransferase [Parvularculaceae bacterium]
MTPSRKQRLVAFARAAGVLPLFEAARFMRAKWASAADNARFREAHPDFSPPPLWWMHDMYRHASFELYWRTGADTASAIAALIDKHVQAPSPNVADWGCGLARVLRHLPDRYRRFGFDYNRHAIDWCADHIKGPAFAVNGLAPPLPAGATSFDALYALSVFTHLSAAAHDAWIGEIARVLKPGGIFLGAFHMRPAPGQLLPAEQARFDVGELVTRGGVKEGSRIYVAYHPERYLRDHLFADWDILEGPIDLFGQQLFAVRKR